MKTRLKDIRRIQYGLTLEEMSKILGCSPSYLSEIENGIKFPSGKMLDKFSKKLNIPASKLIKD